MRRLTQDLKLYTSKRWAQAESAGLVSTYGSHYRTVLQVVCSHVQLHVAAFWLCCAHRIRLLKLRHLIRALCGSSAISDNGPLLRDFVSKLHFPFRPK